MTLDKNIPYIISQKCVSVCSRVLCSWCGRSDNASLLSVWGHGEHCLSHGVQWSAWVIQKAFVEIHVFVGKNEFLTVWLSCDYLFDAAYRIHVHQSTVKVLRELDLGYKLELRGKTEVKVGLCQIKKTLSFHESFSEPFVSLSSCLHFPVMHRGKDLRRLTGWSAEMDWTNLCLFHLKSSLGRHSRSWVF